MLTDQDIERIRAVVREVLAERRRGGRPLAVRALRLPSTWRARLSAILGGLMIAGLRQDGAGRPYVTQAEVLLLLGLPAEEWRACYGELAGALGELGWRPGARLWTGEHKVTPYYRAG